MRSRHPHLPRSGALFHSRHSAKQDRCEFSGFVRGRTWPSSSSSAPAARADPLAAPGLPCSRAPSRAGALMVASRNRSRPQPGTGPYGLRDRRAPRPVDRPLRAAGVNGGAHPPMRWLASAAHLRAVTNAKSEQAARHRRADCCIRGRGRWSSKGRPYRPHGPGRRRPQVTVRVV